MLKFFKKITVAGLLVFSLLFFYQAVLAAPQINDLTDKVAENSGYELQNSPTAFSESVGQVIKIVLGFVGVIFLALAVYAGIIWMTASGNEESVTKATNILKAAVVGLVIVVSAYSITYFVTKKLAGATTAPSQKEVGADKIDWSKW